MSLILSGTTGVSDVDGTAATPALRGTDTNTGIFFPAADTIAFAEGGVESMRLDSAGNLGIGTSNTGNGRLSVIAGTAATGNSLFLQNLDGTINPYLQVQHSSAGVRFVVGNSFSGANNNLIFGSTNTLNAMTLNDSGNLGLGVTPSAWGNGRVAFDVKGNGAVYSGTNMVGLSGNAYDDGSWKRKATAGATLYEASSQHAWYVTGSGSAGSTISWTQAMTLDASGNLVLGTTTARNRLTVQGTVFSTPTLGTASGQGFFGESAGYGMMLGTSGFGYGWIQQQRVDGSATAYDLLLQPSGGNLLVGTTSNAPSGGTAKQYNLATGTTVGLAVSVNNTSYSLVNFFFNNATLVGAISTNGTSTAYNTSSDYRLKENVQPMTGALAKVAALKPCTYKWKADGSDGEGFIAHELAEVVPQCVTGEKDAVDADGNPQYQGIDTSFLVATLTAAIQELKAELDAVKTELAALKGTA